jgi:hypothetical protein
LKGWKINAKCFAIFVVYQKKNHYFAEYMERVLHAYINQLLTYILGKCKDDIRK